MIAIRPTRPRLALQDWLRPLDFEPLHVLPLLTIVLLLTTAPDQWYLRGPLIALFALGVAYQRWLHAPQFWYVVATLLGATVYLNWNRPTITNICSSIGVWLCVARFRSRAISKQPPSRRAVVGS